MVAAVKENKAARNARNEVGQARRLVPAATSASVTDGEDEEISGY
jgi:hypothetical protein